MVVGPSSSKDMPVSMAGSRSQGTPSRRRRHPEPPPSAWGSRALATGGRPHLEVHMPLRRRLMLLAAPFVGAAALGAIVAFSVPALAASPSPAPSSNPSTTAPG